MNPLIYNVSMAAGLALVAVGAGMLAGVGVGLLTAGGTLLVLTAFTAVMVR
jgi:hypothetical protein